MQQAVVEKKKGISAIWILPLIALLVGCWIGYASYRDKGEMIAIVFDDISGVTAGKTQVIHKGLPIGIVKSYDINYGDNSITLNVEVLKEITPYLFDDLQFWIVRPEISTSKIRGLETLISGSYIAFKPGTSNKMTRTFKGLSSPPPIPQKAISHHIVLKTESRGSLNVGSPVLYRQIKVGEVVKVGFDNEHNGVEVDIVIYRDYRNVVSDKSYFWNASGMKMTADLKNGINLQTGSLETILAGGIAFDTPDKGNTLGDTSTFKLFAHEEEAEESTFVQIRLELFNPEGVEVDTPIKYKGVKIGDICSVNMDSNVEKFTAGAAIYPEAQRLLRDGAEFWVERSSLRLSNLMNLRQMFAGVSISMLPGEGKPVTFFQVKTSPPKLLKKVDELIVILRTPRLGSLKIGSPVLYRQIVVGEVSSYSLAHNSQYVEVFVKIFGAYTPIVREHSKFWMASGIRVKGGLMTSMEIATESLESLMAGGIAFATPNDAEMGMPVDTGYQFNLYEDADPKWLQWTPDIPISFVENTVPRDFRLPMRELEAEKAH